jgi:single-strand DNA-binding protein
MATLNRVFLVGNLARDPVVRYLPSGNALTELRLAISRRYKTSAGEEKDEKCFLDVLVWGRQGEVCGQYLSKGSPLFVDGRLLYEEWEKDGRKNSRLRVVAERIQLIGAPRRVEYSDTAEQSPGPAPAPAAQAPATTDEENLTF